MICFPVFVPSLVPTTALKQLSQCAGRTAKFTGDYHLREQHELNPSGTTARWEKSIAGTMWRPWGGTPAGSTRPSPPARSATSPAALPAQFSSVTTHRHSPAQAGSHIEMPSFLMFTCSAPLRQGAWHGVRDGRALLHQPLLPDGCLPAYIVQHLQQITSLCLLIILYLQIQIRIEIQIPIILFSGWALHAWR